MAEPAPGPCLDLDEHELVAVERDDVQLAGMPAPVPVQDRPSELFEPLCGPLLSSPSDGVLGTHGTTSGHQGAAGWAQSGRSTASTWAERAKQPLVGGRSVRQIVSSGRASSSTFTSLNVTTRTDFTKRAER